MSMLVLLFIVLIVQFVVAFILLDRDILSPPIVMVGMFMLSTFFALLNAKSWNIVYSDTAFFLIVSGIAVFTLPMLFAHRISRPSAVTFQERPLLISRWKIMFAILVDVLILYFFKKELTSLAMSAGYTGESIQWFIRNATSYQGGLEISGTMRLLTRFIDITAYVFLFTFINNKIVYNYKRFADYLLLIPICLFVYKTFMLGGRQDILKLLVAGVVQMYILQKHRFGWRKDLSFRYMKIAVGGIIAGIPAFYYALFLAGRTTTRSLMESISTYLGGPIQHFNQFIEAPPLKKPYFGSETLTPILNLLGKAGLINYSETVHLEFRQLGVTIGNVYTFFRRPIQDFGIWGMYLFTLLVSLFFAWLYYAVIRKSERNFLADVHILIYSNLFYWIFLASIEQYSMTVISIYTLIAVILFYLLSIFYWKVELGDWKIRLHNQDIYSVKKEILYEKGDVSLWNKTRSD